MRDLIERLERFNYSLEGPSSPFLGNLINDLKDHRIGIDEFSEKAEAIRAGLIALGTDAGKKAGI